MLKRAFIFLAVFVSLAVRGVETNSFLITTLNCYFFFGGAVTKREFNQPRTSEDYWKKASNLVSLLPSEAPLLIGLQEMGHAREVTNFARIAAARYKCGYLPLFVSGKDTFTEQNVAALLRMGTGWGLADLPGRDAGLDASLSKHLVLHLTNMTSSLEVCVVHLRRAVGRSGPKKQKTQDEALWLWAKKRFQQNTNANLVIFGDFNETKPPGDSAQGVAVLLQPGSPLHDAFEFSKGIVRTHANGNAYDRILISDSVVKGSAGLKFVGISVHEHDKGKGADRLWFTDHFPVTARLISY